MMAARGTRCTRFALALAALAALLLHTSNAVLNIEVHRALQMDKSGSPIGSRRTLMSFPGTSPASAVQPHSVAVLQLEDAQVTADELGRIVDEAKASAVLLLVPPAISASSSPADLARWKDIERSFFQREYLIPVYFAFEDDEIRSIVEKLQSSSSTDRFQFVVSGREATPLTPAPKISNIVGWIKSSHSSSGTIAVMAPYDAVSGVPSLSFSAASRGSAATTLLATIPIFQRLFAQDSTRFTRSLVFVLVAGNAFANAGSSAWIRSLDSSILEDLDMVVCLDDLSQSQINMHVSDNVQEDTMLNSLLAGLENGGKRADLDVKVVQHGYDDENAEPWMHQVFSKRQISSATLSSRASHDGAEFLESGLFDRRELVDDTLVLRNIETVVQGISRVLYGDRIAHVHVPEGPFAPNPYYVKSLLDFFGQHPRFPPTLTSDSKVVTLLRQEMERHASSVEISSFQISSGITFYDSPPMQMSAFIVKPFIFDVALCAVVFGYLGALYSGLSLVSF